MKNYNLLKKIMIGTILMVGIIYGLTLNLPRHTAFGQAEKQGQGPEISEIMRSPSQSTKPTELSPVVQSAPEEKSIYLTLSAPAYMLEVD